MTELFESYEQELCKYTNNIKKKIESFESISSIKKETIISEIQQDLDEADGCLKQMEIAISSVQISQRKSGQIRLRRYKSELDQLKNKMKRLEDNFLYEKNKEAIFADHQIELGEMHIKDKEKLISAGMVMSDGIEKLKKAKQNAYELEEDAINIQMELNRQNGILDNGIKKSRETRGELGSANQTLSAIKRNIIKNKLICYCLGFIVLVAFIIIAYLKWFNNEAQQSETTE